MFTIDQLKAAHSKVRSGADFPNYIQDLIQLGVTNYETHVNDGHTDFFGNNNHKIASPAKYPALTIAVKSNAEQFIAKLKAHQQGKTDFFTFCKDTAEAGVEKWIVRMDKMTCSYYDANGNEVLKEMIPS